MGLTMPIADGRIGVIAGNGRFPIIFSDNARKMGLQVVAVAHEGETEPELEQHVDRIHWVKIGQLNKLINAFKADGVHQVVMLGGIKKTHIYSNVRPDFRVLALAAKLALGKDDDILRALAAELEKDGICPASTSYQARVSLGAVERKLLSGEAGRARIEVPRRSLWSRLIRLLQSTFDVNLMRR